MPKKILVGITGASGIIYSVRLISILKRRGLLEAVIYTAASLAAAKSDGINLKAFLDSIGIPVYSADNLAAPYASSSRAVDAMVVVPCSMKTLASIAYGIADNLLTRAALAHLRLGRKVVLVVRETPLGLPELKAMLEAAVNGAVILPAMPSFYTRPRHIGDIIDFIVGKIFDVLGVEHNLYKRWEGYSNSSSPT